MRIKLVGASLLMIFTLDSLAATFGSTVVVSPMKVVRIYQGYGNVTYVTFSGTTMAGCSANGGYLRPTWTAANGGALNVETGNRMLSVLLAAKSQNLSLEVRFRVNSDGTGWDKCSIDGLYLF